MFYRIVSCDEKEENLIVSKDFCDKHLNENIKNINICAGQRKQDVKVRICENLEADMLKISRKVLENLLIPLELSYQIIVHDNCIRIGPVIGLLVSWKHSDLTKSRLEMLLYYTLLYEKFNGLIYLFSWEGIDFISKEVKGYYFGYDSSTKKENWKEGTVPLPDVVYNRVLLPKVEIQKLEEIVNSKLFNSFHFNKLNFWDMAKKSELTADNIPETKLLESIEDMDKLLEKYDYVYLKPVSSSLARGLIRVHKSKGKYCFQVNDNPHPVEVQNIELASNYFIRIKSKQHYLVQQGVNSIKFENRYIDFRVIMQKDETFKWTCTRIVARVGKQDGICSNFKEEGSALTFEKAVAKVLKLEKEEIYNLKNKLIKVCRNVCRMLDETGECYGDMGIDAAIDDKLNVWILEANTNHDHDIVLWVKDKKAFYEIKSKPIRYAVALSSFTIFNN